jgi:hypothetical protein
MTRVFLGIIDMASYVLSPTVRSVTVRSVTDGQCVGEMIFCVHEPQYAAQDPSFGYNI